MRIRLSRVFALFIMLLGLSVTFIPKYIFPICESDNLRFFNSYQPVMRCFWFGRTEILARTPEKGNFSPRVVTVVSGQKIKLRIRNVDTVTHGFAIPALEVDAGEIKAGHYAILEFTPEKPGKYDFYCTTWCSEFHLQMRGVLEVTAR